MNELPMLTKLLEAKTNVGVIINNNRNISLLDFLRNQVKKRPIDNTFIKKNRELIADVLSIETNKHYCGEGDNAKEQYLAYPVMQFADHSNLLYDQTTFINNFMLQIVSRELGLEYLFSKQCNLLKGISNDKLLVGPALVELENDIYKLFKLSNKFLKKSNIAAIDDVVLDFQPLGIKDIDKNIILPEFLQSLNGTHFKSASEAYKFSNLKIWAGLKMSNKKKYVPLDENFVSDVFIKYLEQNDSVLAQLLFDADVRKVYLTVKEEILGSKENLVLQNNSDFFQYKSGTTLKMIKFDQQKENMYELESKKVVDFVFNKNEIIQKLKNRELYADLILSYIALGIMPDADLFGGTSQQEYFPIIKKIVLEVNNRTKIFPEDFISQIEKNNNNKFLGAGILELDYNHKHQIMNLSSNTDLDLLENTFINKPLCETIGKLFAYNYFNIIFKRKNVVF